LNGHTGEDAPGEILPASRVVDLNTATEEELVNLPLVGRDRAIAIIQNRPFRNWDEVARISGFGQRMVFHLESGGARVDVQSQSAPGRTR
jgi:DNA uptake protein ComE-like DNA-binding protein